MGKETAERRSERLSIYESYISSGLKVPEFARERGLPEWKVRDWIKKTRKEQQAASGFQEISLPSICGSSYSVILQNGLELKLSQHFTEQKVRQLIGVLSKC